MNVLRAITVFAIVGLVSVVRPDFIVNGSFEEPFVGRLGIFSSIPGWYAEVGHVEIGDAETYHVSGQHEIQVLELDAFFNSTVSQDLVLGAGEYRLSFLASTRGGTPPSTNGIAVLWNGAPILSVEPTSPLMVPYSTVISFAGGSGKLSFVGTGDSDSIGSIVDHVQLVPEPATVWALALGVIAVTLRRLTRSHLTR